MLPRILGLQLDTFWINHAQIDPQAYATLPVNSVHLNERNEDGHCCVLGTHEDKCVKYIRPLKNHREHTNWILENDPKDEYAYPNDDTKMLETMRQCFNSWPSFWLDAFA